MNFVKSTHTRTAYLSINECIRLNIHFPNTNHHLNLVLYDLNISIELEYMRKWESF